MRLVKIDDRRADVALTSQLEVLHESALAAARDGNVGVWRTPTLSTRRRKELPFPCMP